MFIVRIIVVLVAISAAVSVGLYLLSGDRRYLRFALQLVKYALFLVLLVLGLLLLERLIVLV